jgi:hypothetical protein
MWSESRNAQETGSGGWEREGKKEEQCKKSDASESE